MYLNPRDNEVYTMQPIKISKDESFSEAMKDRKIKLLEIKSPKANQ